jgi:hypothetical protein
MLETRPCPRAGYYLMRRVNFHDCYAAVKASTRQGAVERIFDQCKSVAVIGMTCGWSR